MAKQKIYTVEGKITNKKNRPIEGLTIKAFDQDPNTPNNPLGITVKTDKNGAYKISYTDKDFRIGGKESGGADIIIEVYVDENKLLKRSSVFRNSKQKIRINLTLNYEVVQKSSNAFLFNPNILKTNLADIDKLSSKDKSAIKEILNKDLSKQLLAASGDDKSILKKILKKTKIDFVHGLELNLADFFSSYIIPEAKKQKISESKISRIETSLKKRPGGSIKDLLGIRNSIKENPIIGKEFRRVQTQAFGNIVGLKPNTMKKLAEKDVVWEDASEATLYSFVKNKVLTETEKDDLIVTADLTRLTGDNLKLIKTLKTPELKTLEHFVSWDQKDWVKLIKDNDIEIPDREDSVESYAENIRENIEKTYPSPYFIKRVIKTQFNSEFKLFDTVEKLQVNNENIIDGTSVNSALFDWKGITPQKQKRMEKDLEALETFSNTYQHLGVSKIVNNPKLDKNKKKTAIGKRLNALNKFRNNNPYLDLSHSNFLGENNGLDWKGIGKDDKIRVKNQILAYQRVQIVADNFDTSRKLLEKGFDSALAIVNSSEKDFIKKSGLGYEVGVRTFRKAKKNAILSGLYYGNIREAMSDFTDHKRLMLNQPSLVNDLKEIDGFDAIFGNQNFCDCEHCRSIFGPAAYFTDLMHFVQKHVSNKIFDSHRTDHPLYLKNRRPDLWSLKLTCQNTSTEIPYLQVVNEVLEAYIKKFENKDDVFDLISTSNKSITLPVNLPLEELRLFVSHFNLSLHDIYKLLQKPRKDWLKERLNISKEEFGIITTVNLARAKNIFGDQEVLANFNVQTFLEFARIERNELDDLLKSNYSNQISSVTVQINKDTSDIQKYTEVLKGLTGGKLDVIHRYLRLWKKTAWTLPEFDLLLNSIKLSEKNTLEAGKVLILAELAIIQDTLQLSLEELVSLITDIPRISIKENQKNLFERLFNLKKIFGIKSTAPNGAKTYKTETTLFADKTQDEVTPFLLAGLGISESELDFIFIHFGFDTTNNLTLNYSILSSLFRFTRIAKVLKWTIEDLRGAMKILFKDSSINQLDRIHQLIDFNEWLQKSPFNISDLLFILKGIETSQRQFKSNNISSAAAILEIQKATTEEENSTEEDKKQLLYLHLQQAFNLSSDQLKLVAEDINSDGIKAVLNALFDEKGQAVDLKNFDDLTALKKELERITFFFNKLNYSTQAISFFNDHKDIFGMSDSEDLRLSELSVIKRADFYRILVADMDQDQEINIQDSLTLYQTEKNKAIAILAKVWELPARSLELLSTSFSFSPITLEGVEYLWELGKLSQNLGLEGHNLVKLKASDYAELLDARNVALGAFSAKYPDETIREEKLEPYFEKINTIKRDALCDYILSLRDQFKFKDRSDLYYHFLLDVEMSGCFKTSRIVSAISSLQLYIHRCLINLEQSDEHLNSDIEDVAVNPTWVPSEEWEWRKNYRVWEANRKVFLYPENYIDPSLRLNKSPIFKELEDELLQEKITQDSAEAAYKKYLAQFSELTKLRFAGAYYHAKYEYVYLNTRNGNDFLMMPQIEESKESKYYLFARTNVDPYQYYYRTYNHFKKSWSNWIKMDVAIEAEEISALVYKGKLYVFWTEVQTKEVKKDAIFKVYTKYSFLKEDGKWGVPQRVYIGVMHSNEKKIFEKVLVTYPSNEKEQNKKHDFVFEQFKRLVFRKPYAQIKKGDKNSPIRLSYIWPQKWTSNIRYQIKATSGRLGTHRYYGIDFPGYVSIPDIDFTVVNNQYVGSIQRELSVDVKLGSGRNSQWYPFEAMLTIQSSSRGEIHVKGKCKITGEIDAPAKGKDFNFDYTYPIPLNSSIESLQTPLTSHFDLSLSQNKIVNTTIDDIVDTAKSLTSGFLQNEYNIAFSGDGNFDHLIEYQKEYYPGFMFDFRRRIVQLPAGDGNLFIASDIIPTTTILTDELMDTLYNSGLEEFLSIRTQKRTNGNQQLDMNGAYGEYYWEMFFHIPFLIANHLNANQKFKEAKWWYERIFNPTSKESPSDQTPSDHNWQFREFRGLGIEKLKEILTNGDAITAYEEDPFNPHAIARLRTNAYQKAIVMKYIDNLIDWGDYLFTQDTRESINEASMLYQLAYDILGKKPVKQGKCETLNEAVLSYEEVKERKETGLEFLKNLENAYNLCELDRQNNIQPEIVSQHLATTLQNENRISKPNQLLQIIKNERNTKNHDASAKKINLEQGNFIKFHATQKIGKYEKIISHKGYLSQKREEYIGIDEIHEEQITTEPSTPSPFTELVKEAQLTFCIPNNKNLLEYWDRVEDRLYKIRYCMNISGIRRSLALFQPPIDPMFLVRARAAGLSMDGLLDLVASSATLPPYRFEYLLEKAKQFTQTVQSFGNSLLSALEKKDVEELTLLRSVHEQNILKLTQDIKKKQIKEAKYQYKAIGETITNVQNKVDYYKDLIDEGLIGWEHTQQISTHTATVLRGAESILHLSEGVAALIPNAGSPFAMTYGGVQLGNSSAGFAEWTSSLAQIANQVASSAGLEATFQRREEEWSHQLTLAEQELIQSNQQLLAAEVRQLIAEKDLEVHERSIDQAKEIYSLYKGKFTNLSLYNFLSTNLGRIYREAYNIAVDTAKLAEESYRFEQNSNEFFIVGDNWESDKFGLLGGERLMLQLQQLEQAHIKGNVRKPEITQTFSLALLDPAELINLRQKGTCEIDIPKIAFEMYYPGQYRRLIKSVKLTIPSIVGPYANVAARLTFNSGTIEKADGNNELPKDLQIKSINTSGAVNDAGMFDFNFRDERYLPFEGGGAISNWTLELPSTFRTFNYDTISDVLLTINYTALDGDRSRRAKAEEKLAADFTTYAKNEGLFRLISLKHEFPNAFHKLLNPKEGEPQSSEFNIEESHFPHFLIGKNLTISETKIYLKPQLGGNAIVPPTLLKVNGVVPTWNSDDIAVNTKDDDLNKIRVGEVNLNGSSPVKKWDINVAGDGLNKDELEDILILITYKIP